VRFLILSPFFLASTSLLAEQPAAPAGESGGEETYADDGSILVVATRLRGQIETDQPPIMTLDEDDVASYGASSIGELIEAVSPQTSSGRGRGDGHPVILLNGQRISSFRVLRNIPPEASAFRRTSD
jgi:iron complex outermembrane recepter protein